MMLSAANCAAPGCVAGAPAGALLVLMQSLIRRTGHTSCAPQQHPHHHPGAVRQDLADRWVLHGHTKPHVPASVPYRTSQDHERRFLPSQAGLPKEACLQYMVHHQTWRYGAWPHRGPFIDHQTHDTEPAHQEWRGALQGMFCHGVQELKRLGGGASAGAAAARPTRDLEASFWEQGHGLVAGVDEAGWGALAGPVVAAACCLPPDLTIPRLNDSKKMSSKQREAAYQLLTTHPEVVWATAAVDRQQIDDINIRQATLVAMRQAVQALPRRPGALLVDGNTSPGGLEGYVIRLVVGGDGRSAAIAAASVLAKVTRDRILVELDKRYPQYGFAQHKGYGVAAHLRHQPEPVLWPHCKSHSFT